MQKLNIKLGTAIILWLISLILKYVSMIVSAIVLPIYYIVTIKWKTGYNELKRWFFNMALSNDQNGNVAYARTFQLTFTKKGAFKFGEPDDTVSYVLARNKYRETLNFGGRIMAGILDAIDYKDGGHMHKAINSKIEADQEALLRIQENKYFEKYYENGTEHSNLPKD